MNIDTQEIKNFDAAATDWWNLHGAFKTLHDINPLRLNFITQAVDLNNKDVIDIGCGGGILTESLAKQGALAVGIDASEQAITMARQHAAQQQLTIDYQLTTAEEFAEQYAEKFAVVTCMELLEHVPDPISVVNACAKLAKPGGHVFFSTINRNLKAYLHAIIGAEYLLKMLPKGIHQYEKFIRPAELAAWSRSANLNLQSISGITYNLLTRQYKLSDQTDVNYMIHCQKRED